jgi:uncharacterized membrane protein YphA (DoxX/SURF4 family)
VFFHRNLGDPDQVIHFFKNMAIAGGLMHVVAFGGGRLSLDSRGCVTPAIKLKTAAAGQAET